MKWRRIDKTVANPRKVNHYSEWKEDLAHEAQHQCVYCCISEAHFGGIRNFHVEHYRPKSSRRDLELSYGNLFYACAICNVFKGDDWPAEPSRDDFNYAHYPDPSIVDYSELLAVNLSTAEVYGLNVAAKYIIARLHLNRPQILRNRKLLLLGEQLMYLRNELNSVADECTSLEECRQLVKCMSQIAELFHSLWKATPYEAKDTR